MGLTLAAGGVLAFLVMLWIGHPLRRAIPEHPGRATSRDMAVTQQPKVAVSSGAKLPLDDGVRVTHAKAAAAFRPGDDVLALVERLIESAQAGDRDAQFTMYEAIYYCEDTYKAYFDRRNKRRTLDEALLWASTRPTAMPESPGGTTSAEMLRRVCRM